MTNYLSLKLRLEKAQAHCQSIVEKAIKYGWTVENENSFMMAQKLEVLLYNKLYGTNITLKGTLNRV